jgi:hypothetical protein
MSQAVRAERAKRAERAVQAERAVRAKRAARGSGWPAIGMALVAAGALLGAVLGCATRGNGAYGYGGTGGTADTGAKGEPGREAYQPHEVMPDRFTALAVHLGDASGVPAGGAAIVQISIDRWSTPEERDRLVLALRQDGDPGLLAALQAVPAVGTIRTPDTLSWNLHYAHQRLDPDGSRHIFLATDRVIKMWEEMYHTRSLSYPYMLIEMQVDKHGRGEGRLLQASRIRPNPESRRIEIENYFAEPVMLEDLREGEGR